MTVRKKIILAVQKHCWITIVFEIHKSQEMAKCLLVVTLGQYPMISFQLHRCVYDFFEPQERRRRNPFQPLQKILSASRSSPFEDFSITIKILDSLPFVYSTQSFYFLYVLSLLHRDYRRRPKGGGGLPFAHCFRLRSHNGSDEKKKTFYSEGQRVNFRRLGLIW